MVTVGAATFSDSSVDRFRFDLRAWLSDTAPKFRYEPTVDEAREIEIRRDWEYEVARAGYQCLSWPVRYGGKGLGPIEDFVFAEECRRFGAPEGLGRVGRLLAGPAIMAHGTPEQQRLFLTAIVEGRDVWCQGFSEPDAGSDLASLGTTANRVGDEYIINGQKVWTTVAHYADRCLLLARTGPAELRHRGLTMFAVPMHQAGVKPRRLRQITGKAEFSEVFYTDATVAAAHRIGEEGDGWAVAMTTLTVERGAGFGALALYELGDNLRLLASHCVHAAPALQHAVDCLEARFEAVRYLIMRGVEKLASGRAATATTSVMKLMWSELGQDIVRVGLQSDCPEHMDEWRMKVLDARCRTISSGSSEIQRNIIAERVLGLPR